MQPKITHGHTLSSDEAVAALSALGLYAVVVDIPPADNDFHWHDFDSVFYVLEGELEVTDHSSGAVTRLVAGDRVEAKRGVAHRERHNGFKGAFGLSVDPATLTFPLELALPTPA